MSVVATGFERDADPGRAGWANGAHRVLRAVLHMLDRLLSRCDAELPAEWFKYPPI